MKQIFKINGVDIAPYIANGGLKHTRHDLDGPNAGRTLDGTMYRDRVSVKRKYEITCKPLTAVETAKVLSAIMPEYFEVECIAPETNLVVKFQAYSNDVPSLYLMSINGVEYWSGITFSVIER